MSAFEGFTRETIQFLLELRVNNNKGWFEEHRADYTKNLLEPLQGFVSTLSGEMLKIDPELEVRPQVNKTISRIYRDTRFSKDKSPYKSHMWITFKRPGKEWQNAPAYFFEISPEGYRYGMGFYCADRATMDRFRQSLETGESAFRQIMEPLKSQKIFTIGGELYKRKIKNELPEDLQEWYQRKDIYLIANRELDDTLFSPAIIAEILEGFRLAAPLYSYFWGLK